MRRWRVAVPFHAAVAVVLTWPLLLHLGDALPLGTEDTGTVPLFNLWTLDWNRLQLAAGYRQYWDAPIFHPTPGAFALSEPQPLTGLVAAPVAWITGNPVIAYGVVLLVALTLTGVGAARLARRLGAGTWPAALGGVLAQALPFTAHELGVLQLTMLFPIVFFVDALLAWAARPGRWRAVAVGAWLAVTFLTCGYYGVFLVLVGGLASLVLVRRSWFRRPRLGELAIAAGVFVVLAGPMLVGQAHYTNGYTRSDKTITSNSAGMADWLHLPQDALGATGMPWLSSDGASALYPGTVLLGLAIVGAALAFDAASRTSRLGDRSDDRRLLARPAREQRAVGRRTVDDRLDDDDVDPDEEAPAELGPRRALAFVGVAVALAVLLSFGRNLAFGDWHPYDLVRHLPGYANLRSPFRFGALVQVLLAPLAALGLTELWRWRGRVGPAVAVALVVFGVVEVWPFGQALHTVPPSAAGGPVPAWVTWLHDQPGAGDATSGGAVAMVPFPENGDVEAYEPTTRWMLDGLDHGWPLVNGYSGFFPDTYDELEAAMRRGFPTTETVPMLREYGVRYVVIDHAWLLPGDREAIASFPDDLRVAYEDDDVLILELRP